jgi:hypothetical protein
MTKGCSPDPDWGTLCSTRVSRVGERVLAIADFSLSMKPQGNPVRWGVYINGGLETAAPWLFLNHAHR